jgi:hypothetical protein
MAKRQRAREDPLVGGSNLCLQAGYRPVMKPASEKTTMTMAIHVRLLPFSTSQSLTVNLALGAECDIHHMIVS